MGKSLSPRDLSLPRYALRREEAAGSLGISPTLFDAWIRDGLMPPGRKIGGVVLWDAAEIRDRWYKLWEGENVGGKNPFDCVTA